MIYLRALLLLLVTVRGAFAQEAPRVTVAPLQVVETDPVQVHGMAFTPNSRVVSHLRRPDGTEYEAFDEELAQAQGRRRKLNRTSMCSYATAV